MSYAEREKRERRSNIEFVAALRHFLGLPAIPNTEPPEARDASMYRSETVYLADGTKLDGMTPKRLF